MPSVGYATLQIIPSVRGIGDEIRRQLTDPAGDAGGQAGDQAGSRFADKWKAGLAVAGAAAGAVLVAATVSAVEKEKMADRLSAQLGLSGKGAKQAGKVAGSLYSGAVVDSFEEGAATVRAVMTSGLIPEGATTKSIQSITTKVADLSRTFDQDLTGTANAAAQMIRTGLAKDGTQALDLLAIGLQGPADKAGDFLDTINEYGTQFRKAGLDGAAAIGLLNQAVRAGARDSDVAADAIKEFSIRAVDGSETSADGFKMLGLNADDMAKKFAKGGSSANGVLDLTLDKLRNIKDPVERSQAAVALFGTQAEDLGDALFAMDPSGAADGLGKVGGAAGKVGDTIRDNTATELEVLKRQLTGALGNVVTTVVLPTITNLVAGVRWLGDAVAATGRWFQKWGAWLVPLGILVGGLTLVVNAQAISLALVTGAFRLYRGIILAWSAVTRIATGVQAAWNAVMAANPIGLIIVAIVALVAAIVIAYKKSDTFRAIVQAAWEGIKTAALWAWENVLKPVFGFFVAAWQRIAAAALWFWNTALSPVIGFISALITWWWQNIVKRYFQLVQFAFRTLGAVAMWLWEKAIKPVFNFIAKLFTWWWQNIVKRYFNLVKAAIGTVIDAFKWLWNRGVKPVMGWIGDRISWVWENVIKKSFDALKKGVRAVKDGFETAKDGIGKAWGKLEGIAKKPVKFIIETVYNNGIRKVFNTIADFVDMDPLGEVRLPKGFATGGAVWGPGTATSDSIPAMLSRGEHVWTAREVQAAGGHGTVMALRQAAKAGAIPRFADGGIVDWVTDKAKKVGGAVMSGVDFLANPKKLWDKAIGFVKDRIRDIGSSKWARMLAKLPAKMLSGLKEKVLAAARGLFGGDSGDIGGAIPSGRRRSIITQALAAAGVPPPGTMAQWLAGMNTLITRESGWNPRAINRWDINAKNGIPSQGLAQTIPPTWSAYVPNSLRSRGILDPVGNVAASIRYIVARYGNITRVQQANANRPPAGYDSGGWLQPGWTAAYNGTGQPEAVLTAPQWRAVQAAAAGGASLQPGDRLALRVRDREFDAYVESLADGRVDAGMTRMRRRYSAGNRQ